MARVSEPSPDKRDSRKLASHIVSLWENPKMGSTSHHALLLGCLLAVGVFLLRIGTAFVRGDPSGLQDSRNYVGPVVSGILFALLVKFDYLIPHPSLVVTVFSVLVLCAAVITRYCS